MVAMTNAPTAINMARPSALANRLDRLQLDTSRPIPAQRGRVGL